MGASECITFAFEKECDDLVGTTGGSSDLERDAGFIILAS
jgi:hypothetical protein